MFVVLLGIPIVLQSLMLAAVATLESYRTVRVPVLMLALAWGITCVFLARGVYNTLEMFFVIDRATLTIFIAPLVEEGFKSVAIIVMYAFVLARYSGDAMVYGFAVGSGFAIMENLIYVLLAPLNEYLATGTVTSENVLGVALVRTGSAGLIHACIGAIIAMSVSHIVYYHRAHAFRSAIVLVPGAMIVHGIYNAVLVIESESLIAVTGLAMGGLLFITMLYLLNRSQKQEYNQIITELQHDPQRLLTEAMLESDEGLNAFTYLHKQFGRRQSKLVESYLIHQEQIAVFVERLDDGDLRPAAIKSLQRAINADKKRSKRIFDRMDEPVRQWLHDANLVDAVPMREISVDP